jgi:hypothetical protein
MWGSGSGGEKRVEKRVEIDAENSLSSCKKSDGVVKKYFYLPPQR